MKTKNLGSIIVTLVLIFFGLTLVIDSFSYIRSQQMIPLIVAVFTLICLFSTLGVDLLRKEPVEGAAVNESPEGQSWLSVLQLMGWIGLYLILIFIIGFTLANFIFALAYLLKRAKLNLPKAIIFTVIVTVFMYGFFNLGLNVDLWPGVIPEIIPRVLGGGNLPPL